MHESIHNWIGRTMEVTDLLDVRQARLLAATLDQPHDRLICGGAVPPAWHWIWFHPAHRMSELGPDGHALRGEFLPPIPLPRRMWAGGRLYFDKPLRLGDTVTRRSTVVSIEEKEGRSGKLAFVMLRHEFHAPHGLAVREEHDIVYRAAADPAAGHTPPPPAPGDATWRQTLAVDPVLLFRYSALTFNGHRIHYDPDYCRSVEHYPGLVVHGPLLATLMLELLRAQRPEARVYRLNYRALAPAFAPCTLAICGNPRDPGRVDLWAATEAGQVMRGEALVE